MLNDSTIESIEEDDADKENRNEDQLFKTLLNNSTNEPNDEDDNSQTVFEPTNGDNNNNNKSLTNDEKIKGKETETETQSVISLLPPPIDHLMNSEPTDEDEITTPIDHLMNSEPTEKTEETTTEVISHDQANVDFSSLDFSLKLQEWIDSNFTEPAERTTVPEHRSEDSTRQTPVKRSSCTDKDLFKSWTESLADFFNEEKLDPKIERFFQKLISMHDDYTFIEDEDTWPEQPNLDDRKSFVKETVLITVSVLALVALLATAFFLWLRQRQEFDMGQFYQDDDTMLPPPPPTPSSPVSESPAPELPPSPLPGISTIDELVNLVREMTGLQEELEAANAEEIEMVDLRPLGLVLAEEDDGQGGDPTSFEVEIHPTTEPNEPNLAVVGDEEDKEDDPRGGSTSVEVQVTESNEIRPEPTEPNEPNEPNERRRFVLPNFRRLY